MQVKITTFYARENQDDRWLLHPGLSRSLPNLIGNTADVSLEIEVLEIEVACRMVEAPLQKLRCELVALIAVERKKNGKATLWKSYVLCHPLKYH